MTSKEKTTKGDNLNTFQSFSKLFKLPSEEDLKKKIKDLFYRGNRDTVITISLFLVMLMGSITLTISENIWAIVTWGLTFILPIISIISLNFDTGIRTYLFYYYIKLLENNSDKLEEGNSPSYVKIKKIINLLVKNKIRDKLTDSNQSLTLKDLAFLDEEEKTNPYSLYKTLLDFQRFQLKGKPAKINTTYFDKVNDNDVISKNYLVPQFKDKHNLGLVDTVRNMYNENTNEINIYSIISYYMDMSLKNPEELFSNDPLKQLETSLIDTQEEDEEDYNSKSVNSEDKELINDILTNSNIFSDKEKEQLASEFKILKGNLNKEKNDSVMESKVASLYI